MDKTYMSNVCCLVIFGQICLTFVSSFLVNSLVSFTASFLAFFAFFLYLFRGGGRRFVTSVGGLVPSEFLYLPYYRALLYSDQQNTDHKHKSDMTQRKLKTVLTCLTHKHDTRRSFSHTAPVSLIPPPRLYTHVAPNCQVHVDNSRCVWAPHPLSIPHSLRAHCVWEARAIEERLRVKFAITYTAKKKKREGEEQRETKLVCMYAHRESFSGFVACVRCWGDRRSFFQLLALASPLRLFSPPPTLLNKCSLSLYS